MEVAGMQREASITLSGLNPSRSPFSFEVMVMLQQEDGRPLLDLIHDGQVLAESTVKDWMCLSPTGMCAGAW